MTDKMMATDRWRLIENDERLELQKLAPSFVVPGPRFKLQQWYESTTGDGEWRDSIEPSRLSSHVAVDRSKSGNSASGTQKTEK